ncbi:MAG TPA: hypothetical protein VJ124_08675, partial [Pyrinomonadaceae bacterium]|nr:hypothetical protein [Pyrinomonadaceae bacterium]
MSTIALSRRLFLNFLCVILSLHAAGAVSPAPESPAAGTVISNRAEAAYRDESGTTYAVASQTVAVTVLAVASLLVTPDETMASATVGPHERLTRIFRVCNTGNTPDRYTITRAEVNPPAIIASLYFDNDNSETVNAADTPITVGGTISPTVNPGNCLPVLAVVDTEATPPNGNLVISLTARSTVDASNGAARDDGTIINAVGAG